MLFQPTNITPDYRGQLGNGTVDATEPLEVSWQVNGNSAMTAFQIVIYQNDAESTQVYDTGKLTDGCPFYGTIWNGETQYFSHTIAAADAGLTNGNEYKIVITQWWGDGAEDFVAQTSASAFITRATPTLTIDAIPSPLEQRSYTFTASYTQAQGDSLNWMRWQIAISGQEDQPFYDTQNIYGTAQLETTYDGFFTGNAYKVRVTVQTASGVDVDSGWQDFSVSFPTGVLSGLLEAKQICGKDGAEVSWDRIIYIKGEIDGDVSIEDGEATLGEDASITWDSVNGESMDFDTPWSFAYAGKTIRSIPEDKYSVAKDADLFTIQTTAGTIYGRYRGATQKYSVLLNATEIAAISGIPHEASFTALITPTTVYLRAETFEYSDGLYPSATLYPSTDLYPIEDVKIKNIYRRMANLSTNQGNISSISVGGSQICDYVQVMRGAASSLVISQVYQDGVYAPEFDPEKDYLTANFAYGTGGGNLDSISEDNIIGLSLYRRNGNSGNLQHVIDVSLSDNRVLDFSVANQQGPYYWYLFALGETTYIAASVESNAFTPCFWDWTIIEASRAHGNLYYDLIAEYKFGKNLSSGDISNNNNPSIFENFTRYPFVQMSNTNYMSGSLSSLIGIIDHAHPTLNGYYDTLEMRNAIWKLSTTRNKLFLKNRKGDFFEIRISGPITMSTMDDTKQQAQTATIPWVQIGEADDVSILQIVNGG